MKHVDYIQTKQCNPHLSKLGLNSNNKQPKEIDSCSRYINSETSNNKQPKEIDSCGRYINSETNWLKNRLTNAVEIKYVPEKNKYGVKQLIHLIWIWT